MDHATGTAGERSSLKIPANGTCVVLSHRPLLIETHSCAIRIIMQFLLMQLHIKIGFYKKSRRTVEM